MSVLFLFIGTVCALARGLWRMGILLLLATLAAGVISYYVPDPSDPSVAPVSGWAIFVTIAMDMVALLSLPGVFMAHSRSQGRRITGNHHGHSEDTESD